MGGVHPSDCHGVRWNSRFLVLATAALGSVLIAPVTMAQETAPVRSDLDSNLCQVFAAGKPTDQFKELRANCGGQGLLLGSITSFEAIPNDTLGATLVDARLGGYRRVLLLSRQPDGTPLAEDLTGQIALAAGRGPMSEIDGVELDLKAFALTGEVGVRGRPEDAGRRKTEQIGLAPQVALERARQAGRQQGEAQD
jgi:hypothetical protein